MYEKNDKKRLYWLIDMYLSQKINALTFCDEFYYSYSLEISDEKLNDLERQFFSSIDKVSSRFSPFEEDVLKYPEVYCSEKELRKKVQEVKSILSNKRLGECKNKS